MFHSFSLKCKTPFWYGIIYFLFFFFFKCYLTKRQAKIRMKWIIWKHKDKYMWDWISYTFYFQKVRAESWGRRIFSFSLFFFSPCLSSWSSQIASVIPAIASAANFSLWAHQHDIHKGKPRSSPFCWNVPEQGRIMYVICHYLLPSSKTCLFSYRKIPLSS